MLKIKGASRGECKACRKAIDRNRTVSKNIYSPFYSSLHNLTATNLKLLLMLNPDAYALTDRTFRRQAGYIVVLFGHYYVRVYNKILLIEKDLHGVSLWLANQGVFIDGTRPIPLRDAGGAPVDLQTIGLGLVPVQISDLLVMYDQKLREHAIKKLKTEVEAVKKQSREMQAHAQAELDQSDAVAGKAFSAAKPFIKPPRK